MATRTVLISGAGIAGSTLAYWLARKGFSTTVIERAEGLRSSGNPVDVRGAAVDIAVQMGVMPRLRDAATQVRALRILDRRGRIVASLRLRPAPGTSGAPEVEVPRSDLAAILLEAVGDDAEYLFGESIASMAQDTGGVEVTFT
ncbi:MAG: FAD-dependent oxidoreductase, partial [Candidatus Dormibacteraceae bacterium]